VCRALTPHERLLQRKAVALAGRVAVLDDPDWEAELPCFLAGATKMAVDIARRRSKHTSASLIEAFEAKPSTEREGNTRAPRNPRAGAASLRTLRPHPHAPQPDPYNHFLGEGQPVLSL